jgi:hypothetical protein
MLSFLRILAILAALCFPQVLSLGATDEYRDADVEQSGYLWVKPFRLANNMPI